MAGHGSFTCEKSIGIKQKMVVCFFGFSRSIFPLFDNLALHTYSLHLS